jgi:hypothetical protein
MSLEIVSHITDLNLSNPPGSDPKSQGDDHIRNIKKALLTDFPNINGVVNATVAQLNALAAFSVAQLSALVALTVAQINAIAGDLRYWTTATQAFTSSAYVDITGMTNIPLVTGALYAVEGYLEATDSNFGGLRVSASFTNAPQDETGVLSVTTTTPSTNAGGNTLSGGIALNSGGSAITMRATLNGRIRANATTGGTMNLRFGQFSTSGTTTLQPASWLKLTRLA